MVNENEHNLKHCLNDLTEVSKIEPVQEKVDVESSAVPGKKPPFAQLWKTYPKGVFFLIGNEFCERFYNIGMCSVMTLYLVNILKFGTTTTSAIYHGFVVVGYVSPLFGSILADGFIGRYHTVLWVSVFYACGSVILTVAAYFDPQSPAHPWLDLLALFMIAIGSGGIQPCVSTFGGDQFKKGQERYLEKFFSIFYFSSSAGAFIASILTPFLRVQPCFGQDTCYSMAVGVPAILMVFAVIFFAAGTPLYKKYPPKGNLLFQVLKVIVVAVKNKAKSKSTHDYWLEYYMDSHICKNDLLCVEQETCQKITFLKDIKALLSVFVMFIPVPFFWALCDLTGDRWTLQAATMNGKYGSFVILPDQMGAVYAVLFIVFIPLFQGVLYPLVSKCIKLTYLRKMTTGGFLGVLSCVICGLLQLKINTTLPVIPQAGAAYFSVINYASCPVTVTGINTLLVLQANSIGSSTKETVHNVHGNDQIFLWTVEGSCLPGTKTLETNLSDKMFTYAIITDNNSGWSYADLLKSTQGDGQFKISVNYFAYSTNVITENNIVHWAWCTDDVTMTNESTKCNTADRNADVYTEFDGTVYGGSSFVELKPNDIKQSWFLYVQCSDGVYYNTNVTYHQEHQGGIYTLTVLNGTSSSFTSEVYQIATDNSISIFWQLPQYIVLTSAQILFSITGLEFSFTQAPLSMKSVVMAAWLLTDAVGNVIIIFIDEVASFSNMAYFFFLFALIVFIVMVGFVLLAVFYYEYVEYISSGDEVKDTSANHI